MKHITFLMTLLITSFSISQQQIGQDLSGIEQNDQFGDRIDISGDGLRIIASATLGSNSNDDFGAGYLIAYEFSNGLWEQIGQVIEGESTVDQLGLSAVISDDGTTIAAGAPFDDTNNTSSGKVRAYRLVNDTWEQIGQDLVALAENEQFGLSMDISTDGNILAIGTTNSVRIFQNINDTWESLGATIFPVGPNTSFGRTVALSADGARLVVGAPFNDDAFNNSGQVQVYDFVNDDWMQVGQNINGNAPGTAIGDDDSIALSGDGQVLAVGSPRSTINNETSVGEVSLYVLNDANEWAIIENIIGDSESDFFGFSVSLSGDGQELLAVAPTSTGAIGYARFYRNEGNGYAPSLIESIDSQDSGRRAALSGEGIAVIGYPFANVDGIVSGLVRVFDLNQEPLNLDDLKVEVGFKLFPNPSNDLLSLQIDGNIEAAKVRIYNMLGQSVLTSDQIEVIDISALESGSYVIALTTDQGAMTKTFIKI